MITNLDIYYSDICNEQCTYCIMQNKQHNTNANIVAALQDGSFAHHVRAALTPDIISLGIWGMEPSINGKYFEKFITEILDYDPYIRYIMIPTNGQSISFYQDFIKPLLTYCTLHKRKLIVIIQLSLDGPKRLHDNKRGINSFDTCVNNISTIYNTYIADIHLYTYTKLRLITKATLTAEDLTFDPVLWFTDMTHLHKKLLPNIENAPFGSEYWQVGLTAPTMEVPGNYTKQDGINYNKWVYVARQYETYNEMFYTSEYHRCLAGIESKTIDYQGNIYDCHLLVNRGINLQTIRNDFENKMDQLVAQNEVIEQDRDKLFNAIMSIYCWATANNDMPESYIKLLGNGALFI